MIKVKKRIEQLLNGIFEYEPVKLTILPAQIKAECVPDAVIHGSFRIEAEDGRKVRGFLYTQSPRIICEPGEFQGTTNDIHYQIDCSGLKEGTELCGELTICSDHGEDKIPYEIRIVSESRNEKQKTVQNLAELTDLAQHSFETAYRMFVSEEFRCFLKDKEPQWLGLYDGFGAVSWQYQCLEEFLVDTGQKDAIELAVSCTSLERSELTETVQETIRLTRNTWGFQKIAIESDAPFLYPEKRLITTDEFAGSTYDLNLVFHPKLMHAGKNYARLQISTPLQKLSVEVTASKAAYAEKSAHSARNRRQLQKELEALYVSYRLKKIDQSAWTERSEQVIEQYKCAGGNDIFADLFLVQLYFAAGRTQEAFEIQEHTEAHRSRLNTPERYGFCLYTSTFFYQEQAYLDRVEEEISRLFYRDKTNWKLQWMLLYLKKSLREEDGTRYEAIADQFRYGCRSRIMYLEAYDVLRRNPFLIRSITPFELKVLRFAVKEQVMTEEVWRQVTNLALHTEQFSQPLFELLALGYEQYPSEELLKAICMQLIKGEKKESAYFGWYEKGVAAGFRITGLYEYYMETMDCLDLQKMPQIIRMYFSYDTSLDYRKKAAVYRRIIDNKDSDPQNYQNYREAMEKFALVQLDAMRISEDLAVLYETFLKKNMLTAASAEKLTRLLFSFKIKAKAEHIRRVIVHSARTAQEQIVTLNHGTGLVQVYDPESVIMVEDDAGNRYQAALFCEIERVFENEDMLEWCAAKVPDFYGLLLSVCVGCCKEGIVNHRSLPYFRRGCERREFSEEFRDELRRNAMQYYLEHLQDTTLPEFLDQISYPDYIRVDQTALIILLAEDGRCSDAFAILEAYGAEEIPLIRQVRICSRMVLELEFEENSMLTALCHSCFAQGKYDDKLLRYLLLYYEGPVQEMIQLWRAAQSFELDTLFLEEKIMMLLLFTRTGTLGSEPVFEAYLKKMGRKRLCRAYVNLKAYEYFVKGLPVADCVFRFIEKEYSIFYRQGRLQEQEEVCRLALLLYYAKLGTLQEEQRDAVQNLLAEFGAKGMRFAFWQRFDRELLLPYQMEGRAFAEYVTNPECTVTIYYRMAGQEDYTKEIVKNYFGGIFVREFTLFYGEELECYLEEELGQEVRRTDRRILRGTGFDADGTSRFAMLNRIAKAVCDGETKQAQEELENYLQLEHLAKEVFTLV